MTQKIEKQEKWRKVERLTRDYPEIVLKAINDSEELQKLLLKTINGSKELKECLYDTLFLRRENSVSVKQEVMLQEKTIMKITEYLHMMGMPRHILGFTYIREAVYICIEDPEALKPITKELYPRIAKKFKTTSSRVERAIRHAIEIVWARAQQDVVEKTFGYTIAASKGKPTNSEFIAMLTDEIRQQINTTK